MTMQAKLWVAAVVVLAQYLSTLAVANEARPESTASVEGERLFAQQVLPLLKAKCLACHGNDPRDIKGQFDIRTRVGMLRGGESGKPAVVPGTPTDSKVFQAVRWDGLEMPPKENDRLTQAEIELLGKWITAGAPWPDKTRQDELLREAWAEQDKASGVLVATSRGLTESWTQRRYQPEDLWSFRPLAKPNVPPQQVGPSTNPIDAFINRRLQQLGIEPTPPADRRTWIRRATFDLTGLPPSPEDVNRFVGDDSPDADALLIERLLESPGYGEQWGRYWLDVVRYADSSGFSNDFSRPNAWRYRDYVIRSFNADKPYDQFVREQLAGDEIDPDNPEMLIAVGFLRMGPWEHTSMSVAAVTRQQYLDDITNNVGVAFLGHEIRCAKCHDHKFDPIPTRDYYRLLSVFAPVQFADRDVPYLPVESTQRFRSGEARIKKLLAAGGVRSILSLPENERPTEAIDLDTEKKGHAKVNHKRRQFLDRELKRYQPLAFSVYSGPNRTFHSPQVITRMPSPQERQGLTHDVFLLTGGALDSPGEKVAPGLLSVVTGPEESDIDAATTGRRAALAHWITSADNPLTPRVMVNRIWQHHFGKALAGNPNNFGKTGQKPTHPQLLDFLASYFVDHGWSIKALHRLIMTSAAYQRSAVGRSRKAVEVDPDNELLAAFNPRRLAAEELRDSMLLVSDELNLQPGGIPARPEINLEVAMQPRHVMGSVAPAYQPDRTPDERNRRTIYAERIRTLRDPLLEVFNQPSLDLSCERRDTSSITPQVFSLFNGDHAHDRALAFACRLESAREHPPEQIDLAFSLAFGRLPTPEERQRSLGHLTEMTEHHKRHRPVRVDPPTYIIREMVEEMTGLKFYWVEDLDVYQDYEPDLKPWDVGPATRALADLCLVLFNSNEFIYVY